MGSFSICTSTLEELIIRDSQGNEVVRGVFPQGADIPIQLRFFGIEPEALDAEQHGGKPSRKGPAAQFEKALKRPGSREVAQLYKRPICGDYVGLEARRIRQLSQRLYCLYFVVRRPELVGEKPWMSHEARLKARAAELGVRSLAKEAADVNGCTMTPDGIPFLVDWEHCCNDHDRCYGPGSTKSRAECDDELYDCIRDVAGWFIAYTYWAGVRALGKSHYEGTGARD